MASSNVKHLWEKDTVASDANGRCESISRLYLVTDAESEIDVIDAVLDNAPASVDDGDGGKLELDGTEIEGRVAMKAWRVRVNYGSGESKENPKNADDPNQYTFDVSLGSTTRYVALEHVDDYAAEDEPELDFDGVIGVDGEGNVNGCEVSFPITSFTETVSVKEKRLTTKVKRKLMLSVGKVNDDSFRGFKAGEVRFDGVSAQRSAGSMWKVTYKFSVSETREDFEAGGIMIDKKEGWDYLWFSYVDSEIKDGDKTVAIARKPVAAHVERVYERMDFADLKIPKESYSRGRG